MTKHKHTPGPWTAKLYERQHVIIIKSGEWDEVASIDLDAMPDAESDAALIAAAPDLLAALERQLDEHKRTWLTARAEVEGEGVSACLFEAEPATIAARAAIKKARGGT